MKNQLTPLIVSYLEVAQRQPSPAILYRATKFAAEAFEDANEFRASADCAIQAAEIHEAHAQESGAFSVALVNDYLAASGRASNAADLELAHRALARCREVAEQCVDKNQQAELWFRIYGLSATNSADQELFSEVEELVRAGLEIPIPLEDDTRIRQDGRPSYIGLTLLARAASHAKLFELAMAAAERATQVARRLAELNNDRASHTSLINSWSEMGEVLQNAKQTTEAIKAYQSMSAAAQTAAERLQAPEFLWNKLRRIYNSANFMPASKNMILLKKPWNPLDRTGTNQVLNPQRATTHPFVAADWRCSNPPGRTGPSPPIGRANKSLFSMIYNPKHFLISICGIKRRAPW
ncbi:MAG TPA: hypothetical protein PKD54_01295 [Pirellulaceae bacterium]|nr:hypothetical protein [Pirellulaceae bacterium]